MTALLLAWTLTALGYMDDTEPASPHGWDGE